MNKPISPETELFILKEFETYRKESNASYAIKLVEKIVFYAVGAVAIAVLGAIISLVVK